MTSEPARPARCARCDAVARPAHRVSVCSVRVHLLRWRSVPASECSAYAVSWRRRGMIGQHLPAGVAAQQRPMPARPLHAVCGAASMRRRWSGSSGGPTSSTAPISSFRRRRAAAAMASVHDLTPLHHPELCDQATLAYPGLISRAAAPRCVDPHRLRLRRGRGRRRRSVPTRPACGSSTRASPSFPSVTRREVASTLGRLLPPGSGRFCLAVGTAEPRKDLPGLVQAFGSVAERHR